VYGEEIIAKEEPFHTHRVGYYWKITGNWPWGPNARGGVFEFVLDARDGRIVYINHGR
jgi:hypothetical protein